jgi:hypothetical protein
VKMPSCRAAAVQTGEGRRPPETSRARASERARAHGGMREAARLEPLHAHWVHKRKESQVLMGRWRCDYEAAGAARTHACRRNDGCAGVHRWTRWQLCGRGTQCGRASFVHWWRGRRSGGRVTDVLVPTI